MSRSASAPSASSPSGMSERRVFSRVAMSSFLISTSPAALRRVMPAAFSLAITPTSVSPSSGRDVPLPETGVDFAVRIDDVGQQLGAAVCAHAVQRWTDPLFPRSPSLWQLAQAPVKSVRPFAASPGFSTSGASVAMISLFAFAAGDSVSRSAAACSATCRFGCVRNRATLAGPRFAAVIFPSFIAASNASDESGRFKSWSKSSVELVRASAATITASASLPGLSPSVAIRRPLSGSGTPGSVSIGAIVDSDLRATRGNGEQTGRAVDAAIVARARRRRGRAEGAARGCRRPRSARLPCPTSPRSEAPPRSSQDRRAASATPASSSRSGQSRRLPSGRWLARRWP